MVTRKEVSGTKEWRQRTVRVWVRVRVRSVTLGPAKRALYSSGCLVGGCGSGLWPLWPLCSLWSRWRAQSREEEKDVCLLRSDFRLLLLQQTIPIYTFSFCKISTANSPYALNAPVYSSADSITVSHLCPGVFTSTFFSSFPFFFSA